MVNFTKKNYTHALITRGIALPKQSFQVVLKNFDIYLLLIPGAAFMLLFRYAPMYGLVTAFQDYNIFEGIQNSKWVGFQHFQQLFTSAKFLEVLGNTLIISISKIIFSFPAAILLTILLNEIGVSLIKKSCQTILYIPHFLSWVIVTGLVVTMCAPSSGLINQLIKFLGGTPVNFLMDNAWFRGVVVASEIWKEVGYSAIVFIAALTGINPELYEAAKMDGAGKLRQIRHITIPGIMSVIVLMFIIRLGGVLSVNTEQILLLYNPTVYATGDVLGSYIYRTGVTNMNYSYATAIGLFESAVGLLMVFTGNMICKRFTGRSIW